MVMITQPQLLNIALNLSDIKYTPNWVAADMVDWFNPTGRILEPSAGNGIFLQYLPLTTEWCEIERGRDFFKWTSQMDWIIGNPPWSAKRFNKWLNHSYELASDIVYLLPIHFMFRSASKLNLCRNLGWIKHARFYGTGTDLDFSMGNPVAAMYFKRGYYGDTSWSWYDEPPNKAINRTDQASF